jgi:hypothetical protein
MAKLYRAMVNLSPKDIQTINQATANGHRVVLNGLNGSTWNTLKPLAEELGIDTNAFSLVWEQEDRFFNAGYIPTRSKDVASEATELFSSSRSRVNVGEEDWQQLRPILDKAGANVDSFDVVSGTPDFNANDLHFTVVKDGDQYILRRGSQILPLTEWVYNVDHLGIDTTMSKVAASIPYVDLLSGKPIGTKVYECDPDSDRFVVKQILRKDERTTRLIESFGLDYYELGEDRVLVAFTPNKTFLQLDIVDYEYLRETNQLGKYTLLYLITYVSTEAWGEFADATELVKIMAMVGFKNLTAELQRLMEAWWFADEATFTEDFEGCFDGEMLGWLFNQAGYALQVSYDRISFRDQLGKEVSVERTPGKQIRFHAKEEESGGRVGAAPREVWSLNGDRVLAMPEKSSADALFSELLFSSKVYERNYATEADQVGQVTGAQLTAAILEAAATGDYSCLEFLENRFTDSGLNSRIDGRYDVLHADQGALARMPFDQYSAAIAKVEAEKANFNNFWFSLGKYAREQGDAAVNRIRGVLTALLPQYRDTWQSLAEMTVTWERLAGGKKRPEGAPMYFGEATGALVTALKARPSGTDPIKSKIYLDAVRLSTEDKKGMEAAFNALTGYDLYFVLEYFGIESAEEKPAVFDELGLRKLNLAAGEHVNIESGTASSAVGEGNPVGGISLENISSEWVAESSFSKLDFENLEGVVLDIKGLKIKAITMQPATSLDSFFK